MQLHDDKQLGDKGAQRILILSLAAAGLVLALAAMSSVATVAVLQKRAADEAVQLKAGAAAHGLRRAIQSEGRALTLQAANVAQASVVRAVLSARELDGVTVDDALTEQMREYGVLSFRVAGADGAVIAQHPRDTAAGAVFAGVAEGVELREAEGTIYLVSTVPVELRAQGVTLSIAEAFKPSPELVATWMLGSERGGVAIRPACVDVDGLPDVFSLDAQPELACEVGYRDLARGAGPVLAIVPLHQELSLLRSTVLVTGSVLLAGILAALVLLRVLLPRWALARHRVIEAQKHKAQSLADAKSQFLAMMSHELRTPMNGIIGMLELLQRSALDAKQRRYAATIDKSAHALLALINDVLDFSRLEAQKLTLRSEPCDPRALAQDVLELLVVPAHQKGLELVLDAAPDVPACVPLDPDRIKQVLANLVGNAIKFAERGHVVVRIEHEAARGDGAWLRYAVDDTGIGIDAAHQGALFEVFSQVDGSLTRKSGGSGLGLAISKKLVEAMGGSIGLESTPGVGSTFAFSVPVQPARVDRAVPRTVDGVVLLAVGSPALRAALRRTLSAAHLRCVESQSASEAAALLEDAAGSQHAVMVLDGALERAQELVRRASEHGFPTLQLLSSLQVADELPGPIASLTKPARTNDLLDALASLLGGKPLVHEAHPAAVASAYAASCASQGKVLVVDDNEINREVAAELLTELGFVAELAGSGQEALVKAGHSTFAAVLMDIQMPEMDGYETSRRLRSLPGCGASVPIIAVTAQLAAEERKRALASGMNDCTEKPMRAVTLAAMLGRWIRPDGRAQPWVG